MKQGRFRLWLNKIWLCLLIIATVQNLQVGELDSQNNTGLGLCFLDRTLDQLQDGLLTRNCFADEQISGQADFKASRTGEVVLDNGLKVLIRPIPSTGLVCLMALIGAGSTTEGEYTGSGLSHFVEHMLFKGTARRGVGEIPAQIKSYGGQMNGWTSFDYTGYQIVVLKEYLRESLDVLGDALQNPAFNEAELEKEKEVILREISLGEDDPDRRISRLLFSTAYTTHPYQHPVIGDKEVFKKLTRQDLVNYHSQMYIPNNTILALTGDFDQQEAISKIKEIFGNWPRAEQPPLSCWQEPPQLSVRELIEESDVEMSYLEMAFHGPAIRSQDLFSMDVLAHILGGDRESRLYKLLVEKYQLASSVSCWSWTPKDEGLLGISVRYMQSEDINRAVRLPQKETIVRLTLNEINNIIRKGISPQEIKRTRRQVLSDYIWSLETGAGQAQDICISQFLTDDPDFSDRYIRGINKVSSKAVIEAAGRYLKSDNLTRVAIVPRTKHHGGTVPILMEKQCPKGRQTDKQERLGIFPGPSLGRCLANQDKEKDKKELLIKTNDTAEKGADEIVAVKREITTENRHQQMDVRGRNESGQIERLILPGGAVLLLKIDRRLPRCSVNAVFVGGLMAEDAKNNGISNLTVQMLSRGTKKRRRKQIVKEISELAGGIGFYSGHNSLGAKMNILSSDLDKGLELLADLIFNSTFPEEEIKKEKELILAGIKAEDDDNFSVCHRSLKQIMFETHPFKLPVLGTKETIESVTRGQIVDFHRRLFVPENLTLSVFGDFEREEALNQIKKYFSRPDHMDSGKKPATKNPVLANILTDRGSADGKKLEATKDRTDVGESIYAEPDKGGSYVQRDADEVMDRTGTEAELTESVQGKPRIIIKTMQRQQAILLFGFPLYDIYSPDRFAFSLVDATISGHSSRLFDSIREKLGLAYTVGGFEVLGLDRGYYVIYASIAPGAVRKAKEEILRQIEILKSSGVSEEEMRFARNELLGQMRRQQESISNQAFDATLNELYGLGYDFQQKFEKQILRVGQEQIKEILRRYFDLDHYYLAVVGPEQALNENTITPD